MSEWKTVKLNDLTLRITKGTTPSTIGGAFLQNGINFIKSESVSYDGRIDESTFAYIDIETHNKLKRSQLEANDILFSMAGIYLGKTGFVTKNLLPANTNQALAIIKVDPSVALPKFVHHTLRQKSIVDLVNNMSGQSAQPNINMEEIGSIEFLLPPLPEQEAIAEVLSSLDDKIDLLHRNNKTLETIAETLFRQWFVEEVDDNSRATNIYEYVTIDYGYPFNSKLFNENQNGLPLIRIRDIKCGSMNTYTTEEPDKKYIVNKGDLLVGMDGEFRIHIWKGKKAWLNQRVCRVNPKLGIPTFFAYFLMKPHLDFYEQTKGGTTVIHLGKSDLDEIKLPVYNKEKIRKYQQITEVLFEKFNNNSKELSSLEALRDTLLPKLMSGAVKVNNLVTA